MTNESKLILQELKEIKNDLNYLKKHVTDIDMVLTDDDTESIKEAEKDLGEKKTKRLI